MSSPIVEPSSEMEVETDGQGRPETSEELRVRLTDEMVSHYHTTIELPIRRTR